MKPTPFTYHAAKTLDDVFAVLDTHGDDAKILAGGQSLGPMMNMRLAQPAHVVDVNGLADLDFVREDAGRLEIGALTRHHTVATSDLVAARCPVLAAAARTVGHYAIRQRGTFGGSLAHADPAAQFPLIAVLLDAEIDIASARGPRTVPASAFFVSIFTTALEEDEMVIQVRFPPLLRGEGWGYRQESRRVGDFAMVAVAATLALEPDGRVRGLRLALGGVADRPLALTEEAAELVGDLPDGAWLARLADWAAARLQPAVDPRVPAEYRRELTAVLVRRALGDCVATAARG